MRNPIIGIIGGNGRMGQLFTDFFKERGLNVLISDNSPAAKSNKDLSKKSNIVIISVPIDKTVKIIEEVLPYIRKDAAIMDFTSIKEPAVKAMLKGKCEVLGMHPMFGNSNPIPGQTIIICPTKKSGSWSEWMADFLKENHVNINKMSAEEHDKMMNVAQGLIHFAEITFADSLRRSKIPIQELFKFTGKASELKVQLAARILDQDPELYGNIQIENPHALNSLKKFKKSVDELYKIVEKKDLKSFIKYFANNRKFFGNYTNEAYRDSSTLIDKLLEIQRGDIPKKQVTPTKNHIALLGPANTFSDIAATGYLNKQHFNKKAEAIPKSFSKYFAKDIDEIFELVEKGRVKEGICPIENNTHGTVRETLDNLFFRNVHITKELNIPIHHALIVCEHAKKSDIKTIISHQQALSQCKKYLKKNFSKCEQQALSSTASAITKLLASHNKTIAVIAPEIAAKGLKIFAKNIENELGNKTTFIVIKKGKTLVQKNSTKTSAKASSKSFTETSPESPLKPLSKPSSKTSIAFHFSKDAPGTLFQVFKIFADARINLTKIESRPTKPEFGSYIFYLDFEGSLSDSKIKTILKYMEKIVARMKVLGSY